MASPVPRIVTGYDSRTTGIALTTGTAGTFTKIGSIVLPYNAIIYALQISLGGTTITATGAGFVCLRLDVNNEPTGAVLTWPVNDILLMCPILTTATGIFGDAKIVFSKETEGILQLDGQMIGVWCYSLANGVAATVLVNALARNQQNQTCE